MTTWLDLEDIMLSEVNQIRPKKHDFAHMWNIKQQSNKLNKTKLKIADNRIVITRGQGE